MGKTDDLSVAIDGNQPHFNLPANQDEHGSSSAVPPQEEYLMFVDDAVSTDQPPPINEDPVPPPTYQEASGNDSVQPSDKYPLEKRATSRSTTSTSITTSSSRIPPPPLEPIHFFKGNGFSSKARLQCTNGREYRLVADLHKSSPSTIRLYSGTDTTRGTCLGSVVFPPTDNSFQILTSGAEGNSAEQKLLQVRARIGNPHVSSYSFNLPSSSAPRGREVVWTRSGNGYDLTDATWKTPLGKWRLVNGQRYEAELKFDASDDELRSEAEFAAVVLSFVGSMSRLKLKGRDLSGMPNSGRWGAFWFMAILGTGTMGDF
ncbi:hypothetical protein Slin15195_G107720 [Septoria linicola]|uniref:Uncharacterized protein n=1 Tax=Septoria linicola TaxID=215465 RepID=A0A9Q9EQE1_9PEZI|nr:hypothetical protein Slin14017_G106020 [Septoria linicola]USW57453.1 hypothetical protein Slin15195_G107720 [Septoria linicola]